MKVLCLRYRKKCLYVPEHGSCHSSIIIYTACTAQDFRVHFSPTIKLILSQKSHSADLQLLSSHQTLYAKTSWHISELLYLSTNGLSLYIVLHFWQRKLILLQFPLSIISLNDCAKIYLTSRSESVPSKTTGPMIFACIHCTSGSYFKAM